MKSKGKEQDHGNIVMNELASTNKVLKIIVMTDNVLGRVFSHKVDSKGPNDTWTGEIIVKNIEDRQT